MPTNDERREVAARLRELPDIPSEMGTWEGGLMFIEPSRADEADYSQIHKVLFGCLPADLMHPCDYEELHARLADLIEPEERTCRAGVFPDGAGAYVICCTECGYAIGGTWSDLGTARRMARAQHKFTNFCPNCGAKVVRGNGPTP